MKRQNLLLGIIIIFGFAFFFLAPVIKVTSGSAECGGTGWVSLSYYLWHVGYFVYNGSLCYYDPR